MILYSVVKPHWAQLIQEEVLYADKMFGGFINGKIMDSAIIGVLCYFACIIFKFPSALLVSVIIGVTNVIPFFGPFIGAVPATLLILIQSPIKAIWTATSSARRSWATPPAFRASGCSSPSCCSAVCGASWA